MTSLAIPVSRTKVIVPTRRPEILTRLRLLDLLYELLDKKLILVSAPAGYGKSSLLIDLAENVDLPLCWFSLDSLDQDPQRFIAYFITAIAQKFPSFGNQSTAALNNLTSFEKDAERLIITLVNEIHAQIHEHFALVLDDYHFVNSVPAIRSFIGRFLQLADENCHLIISSRTLVSLPDLPLMVARDQVGGLSFIELAFQPKEIQAFFDQNFHIKISPSSAEELAQETEGWITGLQLSNLAMVQGMAARLRAVRTAGVDLFDYLGQQVLDQQPEELRKFLLRSSLLEEFDAVLCEAALGSLESDQSYNWKSLIDTVLANSLFAQPVISDGGGRWLRYHHLFQDFLQARLKEERPDEVPVILYSLAEVYEQNSEWEKAHNIYQRLGDFSSLADLVDRAGTALLLNGRLLTLSNWLDNLSMPLIQSRPTLLSLQGSVACLRGDVRHGLSLLGQAEAAFRARTDASNLALTLVRRAVAHRHLGDYKASLADVEEALQLAGDKTSSNQETYADAMRVKGLSLYRLGKANQAIQWLEKSLELFTQVNATNNIPILQMELGIAYRAIGNYEAAQSYYEQALKIWQQEGNLVWQANVLNNMGVLHHFQGGYETAVRLLEKGLDSARKSGYVRMEALILTSLGDLYLELDEFQGAQQAFQQGEVIAGRIGDHFLINYLTLAQTAAARLKKEYTRARKLLLEADEFISKSGSGYERGLFFLERGRLKLSGDEIAQAKEDILLANNLFEEDGRELETAWSKLWLTAVHSAEGDLAAARGQVEKLERLIGQGQIAHSLNIQARYARPWLDKLREDPVAGQTVKRLLNRAAQVEASLPAQRSRLRRVTSSLKLSPPRLVIQGFGRATVKVNGKVVSNSDWQTQETRELFFYFLNVGQPITKEQISTVFWPDISPARLKMRFKTNMYRLRHALGQDSILFEDEFYRFNADLDFEYDVHDFDNHLAHANSEDNLQKQIAHLNDAVELFQGPFLEDIDSGWVWPERDRLNQSYLSSLIRLADLSLVAKEPAQAFQACQKALAYDSCMEEAHRMLMRVYALQGDRPSIVRQYQNLKETLLTELDVSPSPETEALYNRLTA